MAYFKTRQDGTKNLIFTAKDRRLQAQRRTDYKFDTAQGWLWKHSRGWGMSSQFLDPKDFVKNCLMLNNDPLDTAYDALMTVENSIEIAYERVHASLKFEVTGEYTSDVSPSGLQYARAQLHYLQERARHYQEIINYILK